MEALNAKVPLMTLSSPLSPHSDWKVGFSLLCGARFPRLRCALGTGLCRSVGRPVRKSNPLAPTLWLAATADAGRRSSCVSLACRTCPDSFSLIISLRMSFMKFARSLSWFAGTAYARTASPAPLSLALKN